MTGTEETGFPPEPGPGLLPELPVPARNEPAKNPADIGQVAYEAYAGYVDWKSVHGEPLPGYSQQAPRVQNAWRMAAEAVLEAERGPFALTPGGSARSAATAEKPAGRPARVEVKGFRDLGIVLVSETTLAGEPMLRAESADGAVAEFPASSLHFITWLPEGTEPRPPAAITSGRFGGYDGEDPDGDPWHDPGDEDDRRPF